MISVDISNLWGEVSLGDLLSRERDVHDAHRLLLEGKGPGSEYLGWLELPTFEPTEEMRRINNAARYVR